MRDDGNCFVQTLKAEKPIEDYAKRALKKRWKKVAKCGRAIDHLEPAQKHKMRRSLKKLRYLTEFFAPLFPRKAVKPFVKQLKTLQDVFGYVNDVRMAEQLHTIVADRGEAPDCAVAAGIVLGCARGMAPAQIRRSLLVVGAEGIRGIQREVRLRALSACSC